MESPEFAIAYRYADGHTSYETITDNSYPDYLSQIREEDGCMIKVFREKRAIGNRKVTLGKIVATRKIRLFEVKNFSELIRNS